MPQQKRCTYGISESCLFLDGIEKFEPISTPCRLRFFVDWNIGTFKRDTAYGTGKLVIEKSTSYMR